METINKPLVSVIIPCYNCEKIVGETLESVEGQSYDNIEIICINDGSKDNTLAELEEYSQKSRFNFRIINQENGGVSVARNRGIEEATGEYILFLDGDDIYHKDFVKILVDAISNADVSYCRLSRNLDDVRNNKTPLTEHVMQNQKEAMDKLQYEMAKYGFYCYLYRKETMDKYNLRFTEGVKYFEDREFNWKYLCHCQSYAWVNDVLYGYRVMENSATKQKIYWERIESTQNTLSRIETYMAENNCEYLGEFKSYLPHRVMWATAKNIALSNDKEMFTRLIKEYDVKASMKVTCKDSNKLVRIASYMYLIHPNLFYWIVRMKK